jgi:hypothetical protein
VGILWREMISVRVPSRLRVVLGCVLALIATVASAGILAAAALEPAPVAALPVVILVCLGCPMLAVWELRPSVAGLRRELRAVAELRRHLDRLPETRHPLGL